MSPLIILDRDGVINEDSDNYVRSPEEFIPIPGSLQAIAQLKNSGFIVVIASNQSGIARGYFTEETLHSMHEKLKRLLSDFSVSLDGIFYCPHGPDDHCECRKPKPGLIFQIQEHLNASLENAIFIGDSLRDIQAARAAGIRPLLVRTGKGKNTEKNNPAELTDVKIFDDLLSASEYILTNLYRTMI